MMGENDSGVRASVHPDVSENVKFTQVRNPGPANAMFFVDEQATGSSSTSETSVDDGYFAVSLMNNGSWQNSPASRHGNGGLFSFADGHEEFWNWREPTTQKIRGWWPPTAPNDRDLRRVKEATYPSSALP